MTGSDLLDHLRTDVLRDKAQPYLWSDDYLMRMLNEAQRRFARYTFALLNDAVEVESVAPEVIDGVLAGTPVYALPSYVLFVWSAMLVDPEQELKNWSRKKLPVLSPTSIGKPSIFACNETTRSLRLHPTPDAAYTVRMRCSTLPTEDITDSNEPQIPPEYHLDLCDFVAWQALTLPDEDTQNTSSAKIFQENWNNRIATCKAEIYHRMTGPNAYIVQNWTNKD